MTTHRDSRIAWEDQWMLAALIAAQRSADPSTQVGAILATQNNRLIASGYNGPPRGIGPACIPWERQGDKPEKTKYPYIVHAETNAIHNAVAPTKNSRIFVTLFPCNVCMQNIIQAGVKEIIYLSDKYHDTWELKVSRHMADLADILYTQHVWQDNISEILSSITEQINPE